MKNGHTQSVGHYVDIGLGKVFFKMVSLPT
ncbi:uncharacterized protein METZ01_LOCUS165523 [marine metagenome]|uniref:Uncharacterized protein n=1 Tax=marine metagenome TaxID=408172 RepID=A0A382BGD6_9ZZZZ